MWIDLSMSRTTAVQPSPNVMQVAAMFGLGIDREKEIAIVPPTKLEIRSGSILFITGPSGSGKSTLLKLIGQAMASSGQAASLDIHWLEDLPSPADRPLVDLFDPWPLDRVLSLLSVTGLNDAFVMLRRPAELSDGQRYRLKLAQVLFLAQSNDRHPVILADEFAATLDRLTAMTIARQISRWVRQSGRITFIAATTHDDLLESLSPDVLIEKPLGEKLHVWDRQALTPEGKR